ncbi:hypothetical protein MRX96_021834 [Rhipicephalus microplus]
MLARAAQEADFAQWLLRVASGHASSESPPAPLSITATVERGAAGPGETLVAAALTPEDQRIHMKQRRNDALRLRENPESWSRLALDAFKELAMNSPGSAVAILDQSGFRAAFNDFVVHTRYFQLTKNLMESAGVKVFVAGHVSSSIHDIDKLDPIMLTGYGERWEDTKHTALWRVCVQSHFSLNTHHQQNKLWYLEDYDDKDIECCMKALPELLCDKASRKLQKELDVVVSPAMWDLAEGRPSGKPKLTAT